MRFSPATAKSLCLEASEVEAVDLSPASGLFPMEVPMSMSLFSNWWMGRRWGEERGKEERWRRRWRKRRNGGGREGERVEEGEGGKGKGIDISELHISRCAGNRSGGSRGWD